MPPIITALENTNTDGNSFTTPSYAARDNRVYIVFVGGRTADVAARVPTLTGTNVWNITWTRLSGAQAIYTFAGVDRASIEAFWGVVGNQAGGTLTADYGAGTNLRSISIIAVAMDGAYQANPIGATASGNTLGVVATSVSGTLTASPASTSTVLACGASDTNNATWTAGGRFNLLGTKVTTDTQTLQIEYSPGPLPIREVGITASASDIMAISAVEVNGLPVPTSNTADISGLVGAVRA